jgi:hypothetical protein
MSRLACKCSPRRGVPTGGVPSDPAAAAAEAAAIAARLAELKRKQEAGELTDAEMAELGKAERRLAILDEAQASCDLIAISLRSDCDLTSI